MKIELKLMPLIAPVPNINGNTEKHMIDMICRVRDALRILETEMREMNEVFHGRNFQTCDRPDEQRGLAATAWMQRRIIINEMSADLLQLANDIQENA